MIFQTSSTCHQVLRAARVVPETVERSLENHPQNSQGMFKPYILIDLFKFYKLHFLQLLEKRGALLSISLFQQILNENSRL